VNNNHHFQTKKNKMGNLLYIIAVILVIAWAVGFLGYHASGIIHILLVIAIIAVLLKVIRGAA
jgi:tryptophan-rich sensory protein